MTSTLLVLVLLSQAEQPAPSNAVRWRFSRTLYALAEGGTLLYPQADGALRPGSYASLGLGVDNAR